MVERFESGKPIKEYCEKQSFEIENVTEDELISGMQVIVNFVEEIIGSEFKETLLDDFKEINMAVFSKQEELYIRNKLYYPLSMICLLLVDLNVISIK